ncbi:outer membrane usher protein FimD/PapC [Luteibacter sp. OK325]|uniref:fimbria/pilus outer membrane usher protein n=1 Tax=Luteibacter sp. OK325 TaxID=2135670 RepID=UPI000D3878A6|nr:fimbria/pilus outer membrane usher protein [Luteibacter sp. OK325]PTR27264.1 outer membrane usher protein FimD/PapC [Luteibacter sp. OK325]
MRLRMPARRLRGARLRLALFPLACALDMPEASANDLDERDTSSTSPSVVGARRVEFDPDMLKSRGIDPKLAEYFREAPRFTVGHHVVSLRVNGRSTGRATARFDEHGSLCIERALLDVAKVVIPATHAAAGDASEVSSCVDLRSVMPRASIELDPARGQVSLLVPTDALRRPKQDVSAYSRGGTAALLNYEVIGLNSWGEGRRSRYASANTEVGFNTGDWIIRSRGVASATDGRLRSEVLDTFAQRSFSDRRAVVQLGEINVVNPALAGAQVTGMQLMSEQALAMQGGDSAVEGVAPSQARVEVRQDGVLVYSTVVPAGPFVLNNIPRVNRRANLDVTVVGNGGEVQRFVVTPVMAGPVAPSVGYSLAVGKARNTGRADSPWLISGGWSGPMRRSVIVSGGAMLSSDYHAIGVGVGTQLGANTQLQLDATGSRAVREDVSGLQATLTLSHRLSEHWSFALSDLRQSPGYRQLLDTSGNNAIDARRTRYRDQSSASLSWSAPGFGNLSAGFSRTVLFQGAATRRALASWGTRFGRASVSLSAEWMLSRVRRGANNSIYLNVSVPLGESRRLGATVRRYAGESRYGASFSEQVNEFASYRAGVEYRPDGRRRSLTTAASVLPRYFQLDASYTRDTRNSNYSLGLRGGLVLHEQGLTASPYAVRDTFGVLSVGDAAGIRIATPSGPVWTDSRGYAVLPQLSPYGKSSIEVATDSLPKNIDIHNGATVVEAARGAVARLDFAVKKTRRVLVLARTPDARVLPFGATVTDEHGELVGVVQGDGEIFVPNALATPRLRVSDVGAADCELVIDPDESAEPGVYYESAEAVCRPVEDRAR